MWRKPAPVGVRFAQTALLGLLGAALAGCQLFMAPFLLWGKEPTRKVAAEYPYLAGKKVCVLVWAEPYTLFEYPHAQFDVAEHVRVAMERAVQGVSFVPNRQIVEFQRRNADWEAEHPARLGARFGAERVLEIQLTRYSTREPSSPHLCRGHIAANAKVYDTAAPDAEPTYTTAIETAYPPDSFGAYGTDDRAIRRATMQAFAAELAGRFYDRQEKVK